MGFNTLSKYALKYALYICLPNTIAKYLMTNFKKRTLLSSLFIWGATSLFAQHQKDDRHLNIGLGVGGNLGMPIGISYEHGFTEKISGGIYLGYARKSESYDDAGQWKYSYLLVAARASYHFKVNTEKFDPYIGAVLGYNISSVKWQGDSEAPASSSAGDIVIGGHLGSRYWFTEKVGAFAELGYGVGILSLGITFKL